jgi:octaprenyl-diphosphate synthase
MKNMKNLLSEMLIPINQEYEKFDQYFTDSMLSEVKLINSVVRYIAKRKGKRFRPRLCLLSAKMCGEINENTYRASALIEMIHVATLIHDDVVDEADIRRGWPSVGRIWKNKVAILVGDYLFSNALSKICDIDDWDALRVLSKTAKRLSRGEIMQIESALSKDLDEDGYLKMVKDKTSSLISAATLIGAITATKNQEQRDALFNYGEKLGTMFQIKDDLLDITGLEREVGKPTMFDLKKNMLTLPIIHILSTQDKTKRKQLISDLKYLSKKNKKKKIKSMIIEMGGVEYAEKKIAELSDNAKRELDIFDDNESKSALISAINFNIERKS